MKNINIKKIISVLLAIVICTMSFSCGFTAFAATKKDVYNIDLPRGNDPNQSGWGHPELEYMNGWNTFDTDHVTAKAIKQENSSTDTGVTVVKVKAHDTAQKGTIDITKTGEIFASVNENENIFTPVYEIGNLPNAVFEIYAAEDITTLDGTVRYQQGEKVDEITTNSKGIAKSKQLYLGKYTIIEKTAPNGYVNANEQYDIELTYT